MSSLITRRGMSCAAVACVLSLLAACSTVQKNDEVAAKLALQEQVNEHMSAAEKALKAGHLDRAMDELDAAAKVDPAAKGPWLKKAQIHFDAREYGQAITQAQEVLQRDVSDLTAKSILAVSGLRVSAFALEQLRKSNEVTGSTRSEAESVAKLIREALGEPILVPQQPAVAAAPESGTPKAVPAGRSSAGSARTAAQRSGASRSGSVPLTAPGAVPTVRSAASTGGAAAAPGGRNNPFGALQ